LDIYSVDRIGIELILKYVNSPQWQNFSSKTFKHHQIF
jgi:hypothetical protein